MIATSENILIKIKHLKASVKLNNGDMLTTVNDADMELQRGHSYAIVGKSGSGKTSLISIIGLLNRDYKGAYEKATARDDYRFVEKCGFRKQGR